MSSSQGVCVKAALYLCAASSLSIARSLEVGLMWHRSVLQGFRENVWILAGLKPARHSAVRSCLLLPVCVPCVRLECSLVTHMRVFLFNGQDASSSCTSHTQSSHSPRTSATHLKSDEAAPGDGPASKFRWSHFQARTW
jgi:hypothetical protein